VQLSETQNKLFAIFFAAGEPLEASRAAEALDLTEGEVHTYAAGISAWLEEAEFPLELRRLEDAYQLCTRPVYAGEIRRALELRRNTPLSAAALEVLAIIAYNQPVTRGFVEQVRGVDSSSVVTSLVEKGLVEEAGRLELPGRPISYRTTAAFLRCFGLESLDGLPDVNGEEEAPTQEEDDQLSFGELAEQTSEKS
jgi:segregation and condensation protein B